MPSFSVQSPGLENLGPIIEISVAVGSLFEESLRAGSQPIPFPVPVFAMIDTGASRSVIRADITNQLNLKPVGTTLIQTASTTNVRAYEYLLRFLMPNGVIAEVRAIAAPLQGQNIQCLIGRDILRHGVLIYLGHDNSFTLSF